MTGLGVLRSLLCSFAALFGASCSSATPTSPTVVAAVASPDGAIKIAASLSGTGSFQYRVEHHGHALIDTSTANLVKQDGGAFLALEVESADRSAHTRYAAILIRARERFSVRRRLHLELRAYDNGAAFRLILPGPSLATARIVRETTEFAFPGNALCLAAHQSDVVNSTWRTESWIDGVRHDDIYRYSGMVKTGQGRLLVPLAAEGGAALRFTRIDAR